MFMLLLVAPRQPARRGSRPSVVPTCPDWRADDLLWHLGEVQSFWTWVVTNRPKDPEEYDQPERPGDHAGLLAFYDLQYVGLVDALAAAEPTDEAWTWSQERCSPPANPGDFDSPGR